MTILSYSTHQEKNNMPNLKLKSSQIIKVEEKEDWKISSKDLQRINICSSVLVLTYDTNDVATELIIYYLIQKKLMMSLKNLIE